MRQRPVRPEPGHLCITSDAPDRVKQEGEEMDLGMAVTVYGTGRRPSADHPLTLTLGDPEATEH